jgi:hypothetical protein
MSKPVTGVIRRINVNAFDLAFKVRLQCLQGQQVISVDDAVVAEPLLRLAREFRHFRQLGRTG